MSKAGNPDLKRFMDKRILVKLNANRKVSGYLRGFDQFMNLVLDDTVEETEERPRVGMTVIRGNSVVLIEPLEQIGPVGGRFGM